MRAPAPEVCTWGDSDSGSGSDHGAAGAGAIGADADAGADSGAGADAANACFDAKRRCAAGIQLPWQSEEPGRILCDLAYGDYLERADTAEKGWLQIGGRFEGRLGDAIGWFVGSRSMQMVETRRWWQSWEGH